MPRRFSIVLAFVFASTVTMARAQTNFDAASPNAFQPGPGQLKPHDLDDMGPWPLERDYLNSAGLLDRNFLTSTGETVPCPGLECPPHVPNRASKEKTPFHSKVKRLDDRWEKSICSNC